MTCICYSGTVICGIRSSYIASIDNTWPRKTLSAPTGKARILLIVTLTAPNISSCYGFKIEIIPSVCRVKVCSIINSHVVLISPTSTSAKSSKSTISVCSIFSICAVVVSFVCSVRSVTIFSIFSISTISIICICSIRTVCYA